jgi:hypothetical protein
MVRGYARGTLCGELSRLGLPAREQLLSGAAKSAPKASVDDCVARPCSRSSHFGGPFDLGPHQDEPRSRP